MKAVILEIRGKYAAALSDDGCITQVRNKNYAVGQVVQMKKFTITRRLKKAVCVAGVAVFAGLVGVGAWAYYTPYTYVSLDVNPSVEYSVNRFDRVLSANAVNDDGQAILQDLNLKNKSIGDAVQETVQEITDQGYIKESELGGIMISAASGDESKSDELAQQLKSDAEQAVGEKGLQAQVEAQGIGYARVQEAKAMGVTPGKLNLVQKLAAASPDETIDVQSWLKQPVKNIMKAIKEKREDTQGDDQEPQADAAVQDTQTGDSSDGQSQNAEKEKNSNGGNNEQAGVSNQGNDNAQNNAEKEKNANAKKQDDTQSTASDAASSSDVQGQKNGNTANTNNNNGSADGNDKNAASDKQSNDSSEKSNGNSGNANGNSVKAENQKGNNGKSGS